MNEESLLGRLLGKVQPGSTKMPMYCPPAGADAGFAGSVKRHVNEISKDRQLVFVNWSVVVLAPIDYQSPKGSRNR